MTDVVVTNDPTVVIVGDTPQVDATVAVITLLTGDYNNLTNLPTLGTSAALDAGTTANTVVELDSNAKLPAVDGSQLTMLPARNLNCGRLTWVSTTQIKFAPFKGALAQINGQLYQIPSAGVTISNAGLSASTLYYAYVSISAGNMVLTLSATSHGTSITTGNFGIETKTGDDTYSLVGMIRTDSASHFVDSATQRFVTSWFNRKATQCLVESAAVTWTLVGLNGAEVNAAARVEFISWADQVYHYTNMPTYVNNTAGAVISLYHFVDGAAAGNPTVVNGDGASAVRGVGGVHYSGILAEGYHYSSLGASINTGTGSLYQNQTNVLVI